MREAQRQWREQQADAAEPADLADVRAAAERFWQPISTAPKDGTRILLCFGGYRIECGQWDDDRYATKPRPYWTGDWEPVCGKLWYRGNQPTHWQPLPPPPSELKG